MYCPNCGQHQLSDNTRFCSKCGLSINGLTEWLASGGVPAVREEEPTLVLASPRRKVIRRGAKIMFFSGVLLPVFIGLSVLVDEPGPLLFPFIAFLVGLMIMFYAIIFKEEIPPVKTQPVAPARLGILLDNTALPPASNLRMNSVGEPRVRTRELVQPPSVTEHTTKLLDRE